MGGVHTCKSEVNISQSPSRLSSAPPAQEDLHPKESQSETNCLELASRWEFVILHGAPKGIRTAKAGAVNRSSRVSMMDDQKW
jgi:hypothetical protein